MPHVCKTRHMCVRWVTCVTFCCYFTLFTRQNAVLSWIYHMSTAVLQWFHNVPHMCVRWVTCVTFCCYFTLFTRQNAVLSWIYHMSTAVLQWFHNVPHMCVRWVTCVTFCCYFTLFTRQNDVSSIMDISHVNGRKRWSLCAVSLE